MPPRGTVVRVYHLTSTTKVNVLTLKGDRHMGETEKDLFERVSEKIHEKEAAGDVGQGAEGRAGEEHHATEDAQAGKPEAAESPTPVK
jgi:hypothetical protein